MLLSAECLVVSAEQTMEAAGRTLCTAQVATLTITNIYVLLSASIIRHSSLESVPCLFLILFLFRPILNIFALTVS